MITRTHPSFAFIRTLPLLFVFRGGVAEVSVLQWYNAAPVCDRFAAFWKNVSVLFSSVKIFRFDVIFKKNFTVKAISVYKFLRLNNFYWFFSLETLYSFSLNTAYCTTQVHVSTSQTAITKSRCPLFFKIHITFQFLIPKFELFVQNR
jgi:hypothetical protein